MCDSQVFPFVNTHPPPKNEQSFALFKCTKIESNLDFTLIVGPPKHLSCMFIHAHGQTLPFIPLGLLLIHYDRHAVRKLGPVGVQSAAPAGGEPGEEPRLLLPGPVACALLLSLSAVARLLQANIPHQVSAESGAPGLLDVQEHDHVVPSDVELHVPVEVPRAEVEFGRRSRGAVVLQVLVSVEIVGVLVRTGKEAHPPKSLPGLKVARIAAGGTYVLVTDHYKNNS